MSRAHKQRWGRGRGNDLCQGAGRWASGRKDELFGRIKDLNQWLNL